MIIVDVIVLCDGPGCPENAVVEHNDVVMGQRPPAVQMPDGWNGVDTGSTLCPKCSQEPVEPTSSDRTKDHAPFCGT